MSAKTVTLPFALATQTLEALEALLPASGDDNHDGYDARDVRTWRSSAGAFRAALKQPCRSPYCECSPGACTHPGCYDARHERLAQPEQSPAQKPAGFPQPVAWIENLEGSISYSPYHEAARNLPEGVRFDLYLQAPTAKPSSAVACWHAGQPSEEAINQVAAGRADSSCNDQ